MLLVLRDRKGRLLNDFGNKKPAVNQFLQKAPLSEVLIMTWKDTENESEWQVRLRRYMLRILPVRVMIDFGERFGRSDNV